MRLLFVEPAGRQLGGAERSLAGLTAGLVERGHEVTVLTRPGADAIPMFGDAGAHVETSDRLARLAAGTRHGSNLRFVTRGAAILPEAVSTANAIARVAHHARADVVHSNGFRTHILAPVLRSHGLRVSWSLRDFAPRPIQRRLLRSASSFAHLVLANSEFTASQLGLRHRGVRVVGNPVELKALPSRVVARETLPVRSDGRVVAVVGHLHPSKGQHVAVRAVAMLHDEPRFRNVSLVLAGEAAYGDASQRYFEELVASASPRVALLGAVRDIERIYSAVDLVVQPSIHPEGFGRSVVEAQLAGVPVVATAIGGACELIDHDHSGMLVAADDPVLLRDAIARVLDDHVLAAHLIEGGSKSATRFTKTAHVDAVERAFLELETS